MSACWPTRRQAAGIGLPRRIALTPGASNGAVWPVVSVGAADTLMSVAPSAATAAPAAPSTVTQERVAMRRRCLIMRPSVPRGAPRAQATQVAALRTSRSDGDRAGGQPPLELVRRNRAGDVVALGDRHSVLGDPVEGPGVLDALGDGAQPEPPAEVDDALHDRRVRRVGEQVADERAVDLELVDRQVLEQRERGVAGPEVVHGNADPRRDEALDDPQRAIGIAHQCVLGDLDAQPRGRYAVALERAA